MAGFAASAAGSAAWESWAGAEPGAEPGASDAPDVPAPASPATVGAAVAFDRRRPPRCPRRRRFGAAGSSPGRASSADGLADTATGCSLSRAEAVEGDDGEAEAAPGDESEGARSPDFAAGRRLERLGAAALP